MTIEQFILRCDRYRQAAGVSRVWLSKRLFDDTYRIDELAKGKSDVGVKRLARALADLAKLEASNDTSAQSKAA